jgi:hypothetical protein
MKLPASRLTRKLYRINHREREDYLPPEYERALLRQSSMLPLRNPSWTKNWDISMAQALRKRMKITRSLRSVK